MRLTGILYKEFFRVHNIPYRYRGSYRFTLEYPSYFLAIPIQNLFRMIVNYILNGTLEHRIKYRKYRKERKITFADMMEFKWDLEREEQNMLLLRHPYLTIEQSRGHMTEFKDEKHLNLITGWQENRNARFNKRITITDRLNYYMQNEPWE